MDTVLFFHQKILFKKSQAIIEGLRFIGGVWSVAIIFYLFPRIIRDYLYDIVANNRKKVSCLILKKDERFLP